MSSAAPSHPHPSRFVLIVAVGIAVISGALTALQTRVNSQLSLELGDGILASVISFASGLVILTIAVLVAPRGRVGLGDLPKRPVTALRVVASLLALAAVTFSGLAELRVDVPIGLLILPLLAGVGIGFQQAITGQVRHVSQSALTATFINFLTGTTVLILAAIVHTIVVGWVASFPSNPLLYTGGVLGVLFIGGAAVVVRTIGVLLLGLGTIAGQLLGALVLDLVIPISGRGLPTTTVIGTLLTLVAVSLAVLSARRSHVATPPLTEP